MSDQKKGFLFAMLAFTFWGFFPIFWKVLSMVPVYELTHIRILFSLATLVLIFIWKREIPFNIQFLKNPKEIAINTAASLLVSVNWFVFVYAISIGKTYEGSLGYFSSPLLSVLLGVIILKEKLSIYQKISSIIALLGLCIYVQDLSEFPIIAFSLAASFSLYGLCRKFSKIKSLNAVFIETLIISPLSAYAAIMYFKTNESRIIFELSNFQTICLFLTGAVTLVPLLSYKKCTEYLPLATVGLFQYLAPIIQLFCSVIIFKEEISETTSIFLYFILTASSLTIFEGIKKNFRPAK